MEHTIGSRLRSARQQRELTIAQVAEAVRLRPSVVQWLESDDFTPCGPTAYVRGYLRSLASYLDLPADDIVAEYSRLYQPLPPSALPRTAVVRRRRASVVTTGADGPIAGKQSRDVNGHREVPPAHSNRQQRRGAKALSKLGSPSHDDTSLSSSGGDEARRSSHSFRWLPMMWFAVVLLVVAALGYSLIASDARHRTTLPSTSDAYRQPFSPSPAPFAFDAVVPARMPARLRT